MAVPFDALSNAFQAELELVPTLPDPVGSTFDALEDFLNQQLADLGEPLTTPQTTAMILLLLDCASLPSARRDSMIRRLLDARGALTPSTQTAAPRAGLQSDLFFSTSLACRAVGAVAAHVWLMAGHYADACQLQRRARRPAPHRDHTVTHCCHLGCSKCRFAKNGCGTCRDPSFRGKRGSR